MKKYFSSLLGLCALCAISFPFSARALLIDFNTGYTAGNNLDGQPSAGTQWSGGGSDFLVVSGAGVSGSNAVVTQSKSSGTTNSLFSPSATDLPGFDGDSSILEVSFQFQFTGTVDDDTNTQTVAAIQFGYNGADSSVAARFHLMADGTLGYYRGSNITIDTNVTFNPNAWNTVVAILNYSTQTFSFTINGTQVIRSGVSEFAFRGSTTGSGIRLADTGSTSWTAVAFDNINVNVIPEPSVTWLLGGALLMLFVFRGKQKS